MTALLAAHVRQCWRAAVIVARARARGDWTPIRELVPWMGRR